MRIKALATDYDGTLAHHGDVAASTVAALGRFRESGRKVILVTGREIADLQKVFAALSVFDRIVAENGAVVHDPNSGSTKVLAPRPPLEFVDALRARGVSQLSVGRVIVATQEVYYTVVAEEIDRSRLPLHISLNKGALMVLPDGINKAAGLEEVLTEFGINSSETAGVGDAENDLSFLKLCGFSAAVDNALDHLKNSVNLVLKGRQGAGVEELIHKLLATATQPALS